MKSVIIYYSYSGNTKKVAVSLLEHLQQKGEVEAIELRPKDESDKFFGQAARAFRRKRADIEPVKTDLRDYDLICLGTPVWAFGPAPAMNTFLDKCLGLEGKEAVLFTTYGSGVGKERCLDYMEDILSKKGARQFRRFSIQEFKAKDKEFVLSRIVETLNK
jgi:flavodoxin